MGLMLTMLSVAKYEGMASCKNMHLARMIFSLWLTVFFLRGK
jgi:hypothetical protein